RFDQIVVGNLESSRYWRRRKAPLFGLRLHNRQPAAGFHHAGAVPIWYAAAELLIVELLGRLPQRDEFGPRDPQITGRNLGDVGWRHFHAFDTHMPDNGHP